MKEIKLLDCTLRDGGYINNWEFGFDNIKKITQALINSDIDFIECGFLKHVQYDKNKTLFSNSKNFLNFINTLQNSETKFSLMVNYEEIADGFDFEKFKNVYLRICFKKRNLKPALDLINSLVQKGLNVFVFPMNIHLYSDLEIKEMIERVNKINPFCFSVVDTIGILNKTSLDKIFNIVHNGLNSFISLCFHSHNNLKLSYSNSLSLIQQNKNRSLIIDSALFGMGRGAGNLKTEDISKLFDKYNTDLLNETVEKYIKPFYQRTPWGTSFAYDLSAKNFLHPNYAKYVLEKKLSRERIKEIFSLIPQDKKESFDIKTIETLL